MLDIKQIVNNAAAVQKNCQQRLVNCDIDALVKLYREKNQLQNDVDGLRQTRNEISAKIKSADNESRPQYIAKSKAIKGDLTTKEAKLAQLTAAFSEALGQVPNLTHPESPIGKDDSENVEFRRFIASDFAYFTGLTIVQTGLLYYVTVLLGEDEALVATLLALLVIVSFVFYPVVNLLARRLGKKPLMVGAFVWMAVVFAAVPLLGNEALPGAAQAYLLILLLAVPLAFLGVLPNAVLADIAEFDAVETGEPREGMFFAARTFMQKFGQTFGVVSFAMLTSLGRDVGDDLGIRLSGVVGFTLCIVAAVVFARYYVARVTRNQ